MLKDNRHPKNVPGDFYVNHHCCTDCGVPTMIAPDLFSDDTIETEKGSVLNGCYVSKQPSSDEELQRMYKVLWDQDLGCSLYSGNDPKIIQQMKEHWVDEYWEGSERRKSNNNQT